MKLIMNINDYRLMTYQSVNKKVITSGKRNFFEEFSELAKWANKDYSGKDFFSKDIDAPNIKKTIDTIISIVKESEETILKLRARENDLDSEYRQILQVVRSTKSTFDEKKEAYLKYSDRLKLICKNYFTNRFFATMILVGSGKRSSSPQKGYINPFDDKIDKLFFSKKTSETNRSDAMHIYNMLYSDYMEELNIISQYALLYSDIWKIFIKEWDFHIGEITKYVDDSIITSHRSNKSPSEFVDLVNKEYPVFDSAFHEKGSIKHPMDAFMRCSIDEDKARMLLELIQDNDTDPEGVEKYIKSIITFEKSYMESHPEYKSGYTKYYQIMYDLVAKDGSFSLFTLFDKVFSIKDVIKEPWSPLTDASPIRGKHIKYLIDQGVNLNLEKGILGIRILQIPKISSMLGFKKKSEAIEYLISKGYSIQDPSSMYLICIDHRDVSMIKFLIEKVGVEWDDNYPLRAALFYGNPRFCWMIYDAYKDSSVADEEIHHIANLGLIPDMEQEVEAAKIMELTIQEKKKYALDSLNDRCKIVNRHKK